MVPPNPDLSLAHGREPRARNPSSTVTFINEYVTTLPLRCAHTDKHFRNGVQRPNKGKKTGTKPAARPRT